MHLSPTKAVRRRHVSSLSPTRLQQRARVAAGGQAAYDGRVNFQQWREAVVAGASARARSQPSLRRAAAWSSGAGPSGSGGELVNSLGLDTWLLVLLLSDAATLAAVAAAARSFGRAGAAEGGGGGDGCRPEACLGLVELAAWLRSGIGLLRSELPACRPAQLPAACRSWVALLQHQELAGRYCSLLCLHGEAELVEDFPRAVDRLNRSDARAAGEPAVIFILVNTSWHLHVSAGEATTITRSVSVRGLVLPGAGRGQPVLWLDRLRIQADGPVEFQNLEIVGNGSEAAAPQGAADSVIHVTQGECRIADAVICLDGSSVGYGVVVGPVPAPLLPPPGQGPRAILQRTHVRQCSVGCLVYLGGQLRLDAGSCISGCGLGISACDVASLATVSDSTCLECESRVQEFAGGVVRFETSSVS